MLLRSRARILAQLRNGHSWLGSFREIIRKSEDDKCECGARETTVYILIDCPNWRSAKQKMRQKIRTRFNSISLMLGGKPYNPTSGEGTRWNITRKDLDAVPDFAEETQKFLNRITREENLQSSSSTFITGSAT